MARKRTPWFELLPVGLIKGADAIISTLGTDRGYTREFILTRAINLGLQAQAAELIALRQPEPAQEAPPAPKRGPGRPPKPRPLWGEDGRKEAQIPCGGCGDLVWSSASLAVEQGLSPTLTLQQAKEQYRCKDCLTETAEAAEAAE